MVKRVIHSSKINKNTLIITQINNLQRFSNVFLFTIKKQYLKVNEKRIAYPIKNS